MKKGIDVITQKITAEAQAQAEAILEKARIRAEEIRAQKVKQIELIEKESAEKTENEKRSINERALASASNSERNEMLSLKGSLVKEAFAAAEKKLLELDDDRYSAFLCSLLSDALSGLMESERTIVCYDTEGEYSQVDKVIITVGEDDRRFSGALERQARAILGNSGKTAQVSVGKDRGARGFRIVYGLIEMECSAHSVISDASERMSAGVYDILFPEGRK